MKKKVLKQFKTLAAAIPICFEPFIVKDSITGAEIIASGITHTKSGQKISPKGEYLKAVAKPSMVNHERKIKDAYKKGGINEVSNYIENIAPKIFKKSVELYPTETEEANPTLFKKAKDERSRVQA